MQSMDRMTVSRKLSTIQNGISGLELILVIRINYRSGTG